VEFLDFEVVLFSKLDQVGLLLMAIDSLFGDIVQEGFPASLHFVSFCCPCLTWTPWYPGGSLLYAAVPIGRCQGHGRAEAPCSFLCSSPSCVALLSV
jgi:hypothetical protein